MTKIIEGTLPKNDLRRAFVAGCKFWEYYSTGCTMWQSDLELAEDEASNRYSKNGPLAGLANIGKDAPNQALDLTAKSSGKPA